MHTLDLPLSRDYGPQAPGCTCWNHYSPIPSPLRCAPCVAALVLDELLNGDHGDLLADHAQAAHDRAADTGLAEHGDLLPDLVLDTLLRDLVGDTPALLLTVASRRGQYASQVRPERELRGPRPALRIVR